MQSNTAPFPSVFFPHLTLSLFPPIFVSFPSSRKVQRFAVLSELGLVFGREGFSLRKGNCYSHKDLCWSCSRFLTRCKDWVGDLSSLEEEILEFMKNSDNPETFPSKEELIKAGRLDLAEAIVKEGGWLSYGWDLSDGSVESVDFEGGSRSEIDGNGTRVYGVDDSSSSSEDNSSQPAESVEVEVEESGIEGILNRLEKHRNSSFGRGFGEKEDGISPDNKKDKKELDYRTTTDGVATNVDNNSRPCALNPTTSPLSGSQIKLDQHRSQLGSDNSRNSIKPETWRSWIVQRTGFSEADFEDAEIVPSEIQKGGMNNVSGQPGMVKTGVDSLDLVGNANHNDIKSRIQLLESELSSVLHSLRTNTNEVRMLTEPENSSDDLAKLSDVWEFQETEIMNAQARLRSLRAKLAVLEGKMTLAIMDAQKVLDEKQKKIDHVDKALKLLKTTCVVWPNIATEVFLVGSFDGWSSQRKMEKSETGMFSVCLQLYPGKYEIKFIVDGEWKIDPLRPLVNNNGHVNNLLVVHD
ncbi:protein PTST homolog 2, chloroplastic isoform X2 [Cicer arietinum]|uniref:Protein PTST homolog 2, chloroplastic isoform X2 n=1 Tax=Cicer arietinum TaxID=3827 RepID=A0A1S3DYI7_CICAR|nr:protein PTST homolog 2, chloroplastic isoform X2 [Cicer arietinum]